MALGTVPPIAAMMLLAMEGCRGTIMKSCFGRKVFRLRVAVGSSEAPGMRVSVSCCRSPSNETCASPASSSIKASSRRLLSCTFQNLKGPSTREFYHHEPTQFPTQRVRLGSPQLRYVLVNELTGKLNRPNELVRFAYQDLRHRRRLWGQNSLLEIHNELVD